MGLFGSKVVNLEEMDPQIKQNVTDLIQNNKIIMFSKSYCPYCVKAKGALSKITSEYLVIELDGHPQGAEIQEIMGQLTGAKSVPRVFINGQFIGGGDDTVRLANNGQLQKLIDA